jgi:hypothetical protein
MDERDERGLEASADEKIGLGLSPDGGLTEFVGCEAMDMPRTGFSKRDMLVRRAQRPGEFENYRSPWSRPGQNKTTNRDVSMFVVMVRAFLRASLARHNENERRNDPGWWENHSQPRSHRRIPFETNSEGRVQWSIKTPPWSSLDNSFQPILQREAKTYLLLPDTISLKTKHRPSYLRLSVPTHFKHCPVGIPRYEA